MLTIRKEQMESLGEYMRLRFEDSLTRVIGDQFPEYGATNGADSARRLVRNGIGKATGYGIASEQDIAAFVCLMAEFGPEFDQNRATPGIGQVLSDSEIPAWAKVKLVEAQLRAQA